MIDSKFICTFILTVFYSILSFSQNKVEITPKFLCQDMSHEFNNGAVRIIDERRKLCFGGFEFNVELSKFVSFNSSFVFSKFTQDFFPNNFIFGETKPSTFFVSKLAPTLTLRPIKYIGIYAGPELNLYDVTNNRLSSYTLVNGVLGIRGYLGPLRLNVFKSLSWQENLETHSNEFQSVESYGVSIGCAIPIEKRK
jgi:hypothetical protein